MTDIAAGTERRPSAMQQALARPRILVPVLILAVALVLALIAPLLVSDPSSINPVSRLQAPNPANPFGTDQFGRSVAARTLHGTRISLLVGASVTIAVLIVGVTLGLLSGFIARVDAMLMRVMDAIMSIPTILLAIALMALFGAGVFNAIIAIIIPDVPRMARVVRGITLSIRERPYIEAAITNGARPLRLLFRHVMPMTAGPMLVQATYVFSAAVITEAILSFLGAGAPPDVPSWGNIISEGRTLFQIAPWVVIAPGICLSILVLTVNSLGDAIRDQLDPKLRREAQ